MNPMKLLLLLVLQFVFHALLLRCAQLVQQVTIFRMILIATTPGLMHSILTTKLSYALNAIVIALSVHLKPSARTVRMDTTSTLTTLHAFQHVPTDIFLTTIPIHALSVSKNVKYAQTIQYVTLVIQRILSDN